MKRIFVLLFLFPLISFGPIQETAKQAIVSQISGKDIYVMHRPECEFSVIGSLSLKESQGDFTSNLQAIINDAQEQNYGQFDGIMTRDCRTVQLIKYASDCKPLGQVYNTHAYDMFVLSEPLQTYSVTFTKSLDQLNLNNDLLPNLLNKCVSLARNDSNVDAVIINETVAKFIQYKPK